MQKATKRAFTLVELLVVISIIALLLSVLMPALSKAREQSRKVVCANGVRQLILGMSVYASSNKGNLPINSFNAWLWDVGDKTVLALINSSGATRKSFYCPSNVPFSNMAYDEDDVYWDIKTITRNANSNPCTTYRITGYCWLMDAEWTDTSGNVQTRGKVYADSSLPSNVFPNFWPRNVYCKGASSVELLIDATISAGISPRYPNGKFTNIVHNFTNRTNHLIPGKIDRGAGGNIGFLDGHVKWRNFTDMGKRLGRGSSDFPYFWW